MISDEEVGWLYRCLLDREPEQLGTVAAFQNYYADFAAGRMAVLASDEFRGLLAAADPVPALARAFLERAGGRAAAPAQGAAEWLAPMLAAHGALRLAVVADPPPGVVAALGAVGASVIWADPDGPAGVPQTMRLQGGGTLFRLAADAAGLAQVLRAAGLTLDFLALGPGAQDLAPLGALLGPRAIAAGVPGLAGAEPGEIDGLTLAHVGGWFLPVSYAAPAAVPEWREETLPLTVAAIVRNEARAVANMIASAAPVARDFVVLDTGSSDGTQEAARAALEASGRPYVLRDHPGGRFDDMRNAALDLVPAETPWVLMLDADEELVPEDYPALAALLAETEEDAVALPRYNFTGTDKSGRVTPYPDRQVRLLRNAPHVRYQGAVHEKVLGVPVRLVTLDAAAVGGARGGPHIHHLVRRFRTPEEEARKQAHYRELAEE